MELSTHVRHMASLLVVLLALPAGALADTLTIDLANATIEDLQAASAAIEARIDELAQPEATEAPPSEPEASDIIHYEGDGTSIVSDMQLPHEYNLVAYDTTDRMTTYKLVDNASGTTLSSTMIGLQSRDIIGKPHEAKLLVEGEGEWSVEITPISTESPVGTIDFSGIGSAATLAFTLDTDVILSLHLEAPDGQSNFLSSTYLYKYSLMDGGELRSEALLIGERLDDNGICDKDVILSPLDGAIAYVLALECEPDQEWTLTTK